MTDKPDDMAGGENPNTSGMASNQPSEPTVENKNKSNERMETFKEHLLQRTAEHNEGESQENTEGTCEETCHPKAKVQKTESKREKTAVSSPSDQPHKTTLFVDVADHQWPIVYSTDYNIGFLGMEKLHPFDSGKWGKVFNFLRGK